MPKKVVYGIAFLRFSSVFLICFLLIGIIIEKTVIKTEKPLVFVAHDNSQSIIYNKDSLFYKIDYPKQLNNFIKKLEDKYEVIPYSFSSTIENGINTKYDGQLTDISKVLNLIYDQYTNRNIGAIILSTDGIYNTGANPLYTINRKKYVPVYTVGLGDTTDLKDVKIVDVFNNDIAFLGNTFPVEVRIEQNDFKGKKGVVSIYEDDKKISSQTIAFDSDKGQYQLNFLLDANKVGYRKYTVKIKELNKEYTYENNTANFYLQIIDGRQKIGLVYSGIHPDIGAINFVVSNNENYSIELIKAKEFNDVKDFDLIICHNYKNENKILNQILKEGKKPVLYIVGANAQINDLSKLEIGLNGNSNKSEDVQFASNGKFNSILYPPEVVNLLSKAPPLKAPFGNISFSNSLNVLAYQKVGNITLEKPLIYFSQKNNIKFGVIMGEGLWRWRLYDQMKNNTTQNYEQFISKMISYLAVKENKYPFKVHVKNEFTENEPIVITAELYNESYDLINEPEVEFKIKNADDKIFNYHFFRTSNAYRLEIGRLPQGIYQWEAETIFNGKSFKLNGTFLVKEIKVEWLNNTADHRLLQNLAQNTNAKFYKPSNIDELTNEVLNRKDIVTVTYQEKSFDDLIDYKWLFFIIVLLLSLEWFVRKYYGL
jgi:hypothetical protein